MSVIGESDDGPARLLLSYKFSDLTLTSHFEAVRCSGVARATAELIMALPHYVSGARPPCPRRGASEHTGEPAAHRPHHASADIVPLTDAMHKHGVRARRLARSRQGRGR